MNWRAHLKVGDKFMYKDLSHFAIVTYKDSKSISFSWFYLHNGMVAGKPTITIELFYVLDFISPITPLLESLL